MFRIIILLILAVAALAQERLYVVQSLDESLAEITLESGAVNSHVLDLGYGCNDVIVHESKLYVTNSGLNTIQEIDAASNVTLREIPVAGGISPYASAMLNDDTLAVSNWVSNNVVLIRLSDGATVGDIPVGVAPQGLLVWQDRLFVCLTRFISVGHYGPGVLMVYDRRTLALLDSVRVGCNPQMAVWDESNRLHVVCTGDYEVVGGEVHVVNAATLHTDTVLAVGGSPLTISLGGGEAFLAAGGWGGGGFVMSYRRSDLAILHGQEDPILTAPGAWDVEAMPDGSFFVSCFASDVVEHRSSAGTLLDQFAVGDGPGQIARFVPPSAIPPGPPLLPSEIRIAEVYPNPFNNSVRLVLSRPTPGVRDIRIYNMLGQQVARIPVGVGTREVAWSPGFDDAKQVGTGYYFARLGGDAGRSAVRLVHVK